MRDFSRIVVPVDGSDGSHRAAHFAATVSSALGIPLTLAHVIPMTPESVMSLSQRTKSEVEEIQRQRAATVLAKARESLGEAGQGAEEVVLSGDPAEELLRYIGSNPDVLVVMGRRGLSPVKALMLGSVSEKVLRGASGSVTLVA